MGTFDGFVSFLQQELGTALRIARWHREDTHHLLYARDDIRKHRADNVSAISQYLTESGQQTDAVEETFGLGAVHWSVARFDEAVIFRFYFEENAGIVVSIDADSELDLLAFAADCETRLQSVVDVPPRF